LSALRPGRFTPRERTSGAHWIGVWVCPRAGLSKRKIASPRRESNPDHPIDSKFLPKTKCTSRCSFVVFVSFSGKDRDIVPNRFVFHLYVAFQWLIRLVVMSFVL
jgi:hypothetical protein